MSLISKLRGFREISIFDNRAFLLVTKTLFRREHLHFYRYKGLSILTDHSAGDANGAREVLTSDMYRRFLPNIQVLERANVLDLGGNNGGFPLLLASEGLELQKVVSVELNPRTFTRLHFNLHYNLRCEVAVVNAAVCAESGNLQVYLGSGDVGDSIYQRSGATAGVEQVEVACMSFDELYNEHFGDNAVDICKMDIEGAEYEVFRSNECQKIRSCRYLIIEIHDGPGRDPGEVISALERFGFKHDHREPGAEPNVHLFINQRGN